MAVAASGKGGLLVHADPATSETLLTSTGVRPMEMRGKQMHGWLRVNDEPLPRVGTAERLPARQALRTEVGSPRGSHPATP